MSTLCLRRRHGARSREILRALAFCCLACGACWRSSRVNSNGPAQAGGATIGSDTLSADSLAMHLSAPAIVSQGTVVEFQLDVINRNSRRLPFDLPENVPVDFIVRNSAGSVIWSLSAESRRTTGTDILGQLEPGERRRFTGIWTQHSISGQQIPPGRYELSAQIHCCPVTVVLPTIEFVVAARQP